MQHSKKSLLLATTMLVATIHADTLQDQLENKTNNSDLTEIVNQQNTFTTISFEPFGSVQISTNNDKNQNVLQAIAYLKGTEEEQEEENFEIKVAFTIKPFKIEKNINSFLTELPYAALPEEKALQLYAIAEVMKRKDELIAIYKKILSEKDVDGNTVFDILNKRIQHTGHIGCIEMKQVLEELVAVINS
ncbi:MAG TPA: hypothetical protein VLB80_05080 [Candidatus Babeliales bacterium]|nr:hypothetical protein [Candidatus Babeliales bacterium]